MSLFSRNPWQVVYSIPDRHKEAAAALLTQINLKPTSLRGDWVEIDALLSKQRLASESQVRSVYGEPRLVNLQTGEIKEVAKP